MPKRNDIKSILMSFLNKPSLIPLLRDPVVDFVMNSNCFLFINL